MAAYEPTEYVAMVLIYYRNRAKAREAARAYMEEFPNKPRYPPGS